MAEIKYLVHLNLNDQELQNVKLQHLASDPSAVEGKIFYHSGSNVIKFHNGSSWISLSAATGDITGVTAGVGLSGGGTSGTVSLAVDFSEFSTVTPADGDFFATLDSNGSTEQKTSISALATLFAGSGLSASNSVLSVDTLNQNTTGSAATLTTARTIGGVSFNGSANINLPGVNAAGNQNTSGTAAIATTVTLTDESSDTTCFPVFSQTATGNRALETGTNLTFNSSSGLLTATLLAGALTGDVTGDVTGNADTATVLATARNIGGVSFNGSANINLPGVNTAGNQATSGLAATATVLATARTIGGVSFNGSANINLPGVNTAGNQNTSGTAAVATTVTITDNESTNENNPIVFVAGADADGGNLGLETDGTAHYNPSSGKITATGFVGALTGNATTVTTNANLTGHITSSGNAAVLGSFTAAQLNTAISNATLSGNNTGDQTTVSGSSGTVTSIGNLTGDVTSSNRATTIASGAVHHGMLAEDVISGQGALTSGLASTDELMISDAGTVKRMDVSVIQSYLQSGLTFTTNTDADVTVANLKTALAGGFGSNAVTIGDSDDVVTIGNDLTVTGDLIVSGDTVTVNTATLSVEDPMIKLASGNTAADSVDTGFYNIYHDGEGTRYAGLYRDTSASGDPFTFFDGLSEEPGTTVNDSADGYDLADIKAGKIISADGFEGTLTGNVTGDVTGNTSGSSGSCTGLAATATILATTRAIGGVNFNGSAAINLPGVNTAGNQNTTGSAATLTTARTIGGVSFNGSANINLPGVNTAGSQNTTGSAATLTTARTIGGVSFNGSANINLPGVNAAGSQNTTGSAATLTTARTINGTSFNGSGNITVTAAGSTLTGTSLKSTIVTSSLTSVGTITSGTWTATDVAVSHGGTGSSTASGARTNLGVAYASDAEALAGSSDTVVLTPGNLAARSYRAAIGDGSATAIAVTHSLGTRDVNVQLYDASSYETVYAQIVRTSTSVVTATFNSAPSSGDIIILINKID